MYKSGPKTRSIIFYPEIKTGIELTDYYYRLLWYLNPLVENIDRVTFISDLKIDQTAPPPDYMDQSILQYRDKFATKIETISPQNRKLIKQKLLEADCILSLLSRNEVIKSIKQRYRLSLPGQTRIYYIDYQTSRYEGSFWLKLAQEVFEKQVEYYELSKSRFKKMEASLPEGPIYLLGTGPSLSQVMEMDLSDGIVFACNTMVKNTQLMDKITPPLIIAGDPIFHAGCSAFAADFRRDLCHCLDRYNSWLVVPMRDYHIYLHNLPACFNEKIVAIPFEDDDSIHYDLQSKYAVTTTSNILTLFLLPLAAYFSDDIRIGGCDGRPLNENNYFWKHDPSSQFTDKLKDLKVAHPAFFDISYDDYYLEHCSILEKWIRKLEDDGKQVLSINPSYIPALNKRYIHRDKTKPLVSIIMPVYNAEPFLSQAIESAQAQDIQDWELLVIDDGSVDESMSTARRYADHDSRLRLLKNPKKGVSSARNHGLDLARGEYIVFLDADDFYYDHALSARLELLEKDLTKHVSFISVEVVDKNSSPLNWKLSQKERISVEDMCVNTIPITSPMLRFSVIGDLRFDEYLTNGEDWFFLFMLSAKVRAFYNARYGAVAYRMHPSSAVKKDFFKHEKRLRKVIDLIYKYIEEAKVALPNHAIISIKSKEVVKRKRMVMILIWSLLDKNADHINELIKDSKFCEFMNDKRNKSKIKNMFINTVIRYYTCHSAQVPLLLYNNCIIDNLEYFKIKDHFPLFYSLVKEIIDLNISFSIAKDLALIGPFERSMQAFIDETACITQLFSRSLRGSVMIDVGAFHGSSFMPFLKKGWRILAFEPDQINILDLKDRLKQKDNASLVYLDHRAVSNKNSKQVSLYRSKESDGITALSAFHHSHREAQKVETVTLKEALKPHDLSAVDFLKIDAEGYDLFVLQGFPWERFKPALIECEFEDAKTLPLGYSWQNLAEFLYQKDYSVYVSEWHPIIIYGVKHDWRQLLRYPCILCSEKAWGNLIAFRDPIDETILIDAVKSTINFTPLIHKIEHQEDDNILENK